MEHLDWYRRNLPHFDQAGRCQFVTFALSGTYIGAPEKELEFPESANYSRRIPGAPRWLEDPFCAEQVADACRFGDGVRYHLHAWVIMPDHVHLLLQQCEGWPLHRVIGDMKRFSALNCNRHLGRSGTFWAQEYWDRMIRSEAHYSQVEAYIRQNPVKAGLAEVPELYRWSHAWKAPDI